MEFSRRLSVAKPGCVNDLRRGEAQRCTWSRRKVKLGSRKQEPISGGSQNTGSYP